MVDPHGTQVTLQDFSVKHLLIEEWLAPCGPCLKEIEYVEPIKAEVGHKNRRVVVACLSDKKQWLSILESRNLTNGQYLIEIDRNSKYRDNYRKASSFPLFILISPDYKVTFPFAIEPNPDVVNHGTGN